MPCQRRGKCCKEFSIALPFDTELVRFYRYHGVTVRRRSETVMELFFAARCMHYRDDRCVIYEDRPTICRDYLCEEARKADS